MSENAAKTIYLLVSVSLLVYSAYAPMYNLPILVMSILMIIAGKP
jgi:hypothetical protein